MLSIVASILIGIVVGWLTRFAWKRLTRITVKSLSGTLSVLLGGSVSVVLAGSANALWWYIIGLTIGFVLYSLVGAIAVRQERRPGEFEGILYDMTDEKDADKEQSWVYKLARMIT